MAAISVYLANIVLNQVLRNIAYTPPTAVYLALYTDDPTQSDVGTEVSGGAYARQAITFNAASGGQVVNSGDVVFPQATASWGTVTHVGVRDAATGGNLLFYGPLDIPKTIDVGDQFKIPDGKLTIVLS